MRRGFAWKSTPADILFRRLYTCCMIIKHRCTGSRNPFRTLRTVHLFCDSVFLCAASCLENNILAAKDCVLLSPSHLQYDKNTFVTGHWSLYNQHFWHFDFSRMRLSKQTNINEKQKYPPIVRKWKVNFWRKVRLVGYVLLITVSYEDDGKFVFILTFPAHSGISNIVYSLTIFNSSPII